MRLREEHRALLQDAGLGLNGLRLLDQLFQRPLVNVNLVRDSLGGSSYNTANNLVEQFTALGLLREVTGKQRNRVFRYTPYWGLLQEPEPTVQENVTVQTTESEEQ
ncbi:MAG: hypothetical protein H0X71_12025 [Rubrobacter sp.]|nr:hypothetical protein [Rubrobacter sp.]